MHSISDDDAHRLGRWDEGLGQERVEVEAIPHEAVADLALRLARHERLHVVHERAPRAKNADRASCSDRHDELVVRVDEGRPQARLVGAQRPPGGEDRAQHRVGVELEESGLLRVDPLLEHREHGVREALGDVAARGEAEAEHVLADLHRGGLAVARAQPHEAAFPPLRGVRRELVEEGFVVVRENVHLVVEQVGDVPEHG